MNLVPNDPRPDLPDHSADRELDPTLAAELRALPLEMPPPRDLWPAIASRVRQQRQTRQLRQLFALAAIFALVSIAAWLWRPGRHAPAPVSQQARVESGMPVVAASAVWRTAYSESDLALAEIREQLAREIEAQKDRLPPATRELVFENLRTIDRAIAEIEQALAREPANPELGRTYIAYRERQIDLLRQANRTAARL